MDFNYLVEGYADKILIEVMRIPEKKIYIMGNIGAISKRMIKAIEKDEFIVIFGTIDNDKNKKSKHFNKFELVYETENFIYKHLEKNRQYLIILKPALEKFILNAAKQGNINPDDFQVPLNFDDFKNLTKKSEIQNNIDFKNFLKAIYKTNSCFSELKDLLFNIHKRFSLPDFWQ